MSQNSAADTGLRLGLGRPKAVSGVSTFAASPQLACLKSLPLLSESVDKLKSGAAPLKSLARSFAGEGKGEGAESFFSV